MCLSLTVFAPRGQRYLAPFFLSCLAKWAAEPAKVPIVAWIVWARNPASRVPFRRDCPFPDPGPLGAPIDPRRGHPAAAQNSLLRPGLGVCQLRWHLSANQEPVHGGLWSSRTERSHVVGFLFLFLFPFPLGWVDGRVAET